MLGRAMDAVELGQQLEMMERDPMRFAEDIAQVCEELDERRWYAKVRNALIAATPNRQDAIQLWTAVTADYPDNRAQQHWLFREYLHRNKLITDAVYKATPRRYQLPEKELARRKAAGAEWAALRKRRDDLLARVGRENQRVACEAYNRLAITCPVFCRERVDLWENELRRLGLLRGGNKMLGTRANKQLAGGAANK